MLPTRLICIDGMPGSGKSTTSQRLFLHLLKQGHAARWCYEHGPDSPIWGGAERYRLTQSEAADPQTVRELVVSRWQALCAELEAAPTIVVIESSLLQSTIGVLLAMNADEEAILGCLRDVTKAIATLQPVSIYLHPADVGAALRAICNLRRHDQFEAPVLELLSKTRYAKTHWMGGFDGAVQFFQRCREITDRAFAALEFPKLGIDYSARDWPAYERQITTLLGLPDMPPLSGHVDGSDRYVGRYIDPASGADLVVAADEKGLYLNDDRRTRLMRDRDDVFQVNAMWLELSFKNQKKGSFQHVELKGHVPDVSPVWVRADDRR